ncbi:putative disease resistance protein [Camellia lanceoleosa]|uniref:Disease resistance protein n=1 Tax=Camellia lanceoleosa TaxID=1840588 RepID=A0ACC0IAT7_9ERIC|nr:putative disease resistance protein [Camellia lanceoleosa]
MAGLGKTTLAKKIFKSAQHNFERSAWIYVSQQPNIRELLRDIARQVGFKKEKWEENVDVNLFTFLSQHRYVIVLDDMWHIETWNAIKNAIPTNTKNGSRIILTSRNNDVGTHVGGKSSLHELRPLNEENSRKLFFKMVMVEATDHPQLETIGEQILKNAGFIQGSGVREVEEVGDDYLNHLIARNLIQVIRRRFDGKVRSCRIHDILHDLCILVAKEINFFNTQNDVITCNRGMGVRRVTTHGSNFENYISLNYRMPKLRSMLSFSGNPSLVRRKVAKNFLRDFEFLRVLSVKCYYLPRALPNEVGNLKNLHYLGLGSADYIEIPHTISNSKGLLTFDVRESGGCTYILLPHSCYAPSFCGINLVRIFYRTGICLPNLQTLYGLMEDVWCDFSYLHKLVNLRKLGVNSSSQRIIEILSDPALVLTKLEKLLLSDISCEIFRTWNLSRYKNLLSLKLKRNWLLNFKLPQHDKLLPNLTKLTLSCNFLKEDPMETLKKLPKLKILKLYHILYVGSKMVCPGAPGSNCPQLEVLKIYQLEELEELIVEEGGMPRLKKLVIFWCNPITTVPDRIKNIMEIHKDKPV